jgi:hypothetical protein
LKLRQWPYKYQKKAFAPFFPQNCKNEIKRRTWKEKSGAMGKIMKKSCVRVAQAQQKQESIAQSFKHNQM